MQMVVSRDAALPKLAWFAKVDVHGRLVEAEVGPMVEVDPAPSPRWLVAGMWLGPFEEGAFHRAEAIFGSGLRLDDDGLHVVPASTTVERCVYARDGATWYVSNSLVVLLGRLGARIDLRFDHRDWGESMALGVFNYVRQFHVLHPRIPTMSQLIFESLRLAPDGSPSFHFRDRPRTFDTYADYLRQWSEAIAALHANASSKARRYPMRSITSASRGYDSSAVTAVVTTLEPGLLSWTAARSNTRVPRLLQGLMNANVADDDGSEIARKLGATPRYLDLGLRAMPKELEAWCWATAQISPELVFHSMLTEADAHPVPTVFWAGHVGDGAWERQLGELGLSGQIVRGAQSGYALIEARLRYGVVEASVPYLFMRSVAAINAVSRSAEMKPWQLGNDYDRPIPRRLLEERGVPREAFGFGKKAVAQDYESPQGDALREVFFDQTQWTAITERLYRGVNLGIYFAQRASDFVQASGDRGKLVARARRFGKRSLASVADLQRQTFFLATHLLAERYAARGPSSA
ncbi:MAG: hypothetical protein MUC96_06050 [Myxococcaceae bacterium]|jgi:hypothetical protein|nr:hypothetical protein [Myxococcaceae bacterium]